jgi:hexokinase
MKINLCVITLSDLEEGKVSQVDKQMIIDDATKQSTQEVLFDFIAKSVSEFIKERNIAAALPLGFTFSFPVAQTSLISGTLIRWTKDFSATGAVGKDVVQLLREAFVRRGVSPSCFSMSREGGWFCMLVFFRPHQFNLLDHRFFLCRCDQAGWSEKNNKDDL